MNVELIDNENPARLWVSIYSSFDVILKVFFSTSRTKGMTNYLTFGDMPISNQASSTMSNVLKLDALYPFWFHRAGSDRPF